jgi:copper resistance protein C
VTRRRLLALAGALALPAAVPLHAHSLLLEASPAPDATVTAPREIRLRFNNRVERSLSRVTIADVAGTRHELALVPEAAPDRLTASVPAALAPGPYRVDWRVLSSDGHVVDGGYTFRVAP